jgi:hypothetical protein
MFIYILVDPRDTQIRYVGSTVCSVASKLATHLHDSKRQNHAVSGWIRELISIGLRPGIEIIETYIDEAEMRKDEEFYIRYLSFIGVPLLNTTYLRKAQYKDHLTMEHRKKLSIAKQGLFNLKKRKRVGQYTLGGDFIREWLGVIEAQKQMNCKAISVTIKKHGRAAGYIWRYLS